MNMMRYRNQPGAILRELQKELFPFAQLLSEEAQPTFALEQWAPSVDIKEEEKEFVVYADIPGVKAKDIDIEMEGNSLVIKGHRKTEKEEKGKNYYRSECQTGKFYRQFTLPESVDSAKITARKEEGVLILHLPKATENKHFRKIDIQEGK